MTLTVRLPPRVEQKLAEYCAKQGVSKSDAVKDALALLLENEAGENAADHPFVGADRGDGSDVSGNVKPALRAKFRRVHR